MENLKNETIGTIERIGKKVEDVLWVGEGARFMTWDEFLLVSDKEYDSGYGTNEVEEGLVIAFEDSWLERWEYDGSEGWVYKKYPTKPAEKEVFSPFVV